MDKEIGEFVNQCFHCLSCEGPFRAPRPFGESIHAIGLNQVIHFDYLFLRNPSRFSKHDYRHVLVLMDDLSTYVQLSRLLGLLQKL